MSILEGGKRRFGLKVSSLDVAIEGAEKLLECIRKSLGVTAGIVGDGSGGRAQQRRIPLQQLVWFMPMADPQFVGCFTVP